MHGEHLRNCITCTERLSIYGKKRNSVASSIGKRKRDVDVEATQLPTGRCSGWTGGFAGCRLRTQYWWAVRTGSCTPERLSSD